MKKYWLLIVPVICVLVGCHSGNYAAMGYQPMRAMEVPGARDVLVQLRVTDSRENTRAVSDYNAIVEDVEYKNTVIGDLWSGATDVVNTQTTKYRKEKRYIYAHNDPAELVEAAFAAELRSRGFRLTERSGADVIIDVELTSFYNRFEKTGLFEARAMSQMKMSVKTISGDSHQVDFVKNVVGDGVVLDIYNCDGKNAGMALQGALEDGMRKLFSNYNFIEALRSETQVVDLD